ncbi:MAG TPA: beta-propeller fold lactonase family protein, partial [Planctomycetaceae bacterium]
MFSQARFTRQITAFLISILSASAVLAMAANIAAQTTETPSQLTSRIERLIRQLDDDSEKVSEEARSSLVEIGLPALKPLNEAAKDVTTEGGRLAAGIVRDIARTAAGLRMRSQTKTTGLQGAVTVELSRDGRYVYVPGHVAAAINVFRRDSRTGELAIQQCIVDRDQMDGVVTLRLSTDGKFAVAAACRSKTIALYSRDETNGELTLASMRRQEPDGELQNLEWPINAIFSTDGKFVYVIDDHKGTVLVFRCTGGLTFVEIFEGPDHCFDGARGLTAHPDGKTLYISSHRAGTLVVLNRDPETGKVSIRQILHDEEDGVHGLAGTIYTCVSRDGEFVYSISGRFAGDDAIGVFQVGDDGKLSVLQEFINGDGELQDFKGGGVGIAISPDGTRFYASGTRSGSLACFRRDPVGGKLTYVTTLTSLETGESGTFVDNRRAVGNQLMVGNLGANGVDISSDGRFLYLALEGWSAISVLEQTA